MPAGRPLKFQSVKDLQAKIDAYFEERKQATLPFTVSGLALALDTSRQTLLEYEGEVPGREKRDPGYADAIKRAKLRCEDYAETEMYRSRNAAGPIFALKNFGWSDRHEVTGKDGAPLILPAEIINKNLLLGDSHSGPGTNSQ